MECLMRLAENPSPNPLADDACSASERNSPAARFGDYELLRQIGRGGMGVVYEARQISLNRIVALKMILGGDMASASAVRRFRVEAEAAAKLAHPNIVAIHEFGERDGLPFFSMQRIEGADLARAKATLALPILDRTSGKKTAEREAQLRIAKLVATLARALHYAHRQGIIHCDLKPSNILIDRCGEPHVTDFGIAHFLDREGLLTKSGVIGTPRYMAPEQAGGRRGDVTPATDIHGLGVILYELLTGQAPFGAPTPGETLRQVIEQEPVVPHDSNPAVHPDLSIICLKCLEKNARHRYGSAAELADDLDRWIRHEPILARRASSPERLLRWCQRNPAIATLAASVTLLLMTVAIGSALFAWNLSEKDKQQKAVIRFMQAEKKNELDELWEHPKSPSVKIKAEERAVLMGKDPHRPSPYSGKEVRLRFGIYSFLKPSAMEKKFNPLLESLEKGAAEHLRRPVRIDCIIYRSYTDGHQGLLSGEVHFMRMGPASYVLMKQKSPGISLLVAEENLIECEIFTRADSPVQTLTDIKGKKFAFGDPESTYGTHLAKLVLLRAGIRAGDLGTNSRHFPSHDAVPNAVKFGAYDAGSANIIAIDPSFKVVHTFTNVLRMPFVARDGIDPTEAQALRRALLAQDSPFVLTNLVPNLKGFRQVLDQDYDSLRKWMKEAEQFGEL
jgi:serine/threonine protein kinase